MMWLLVVWVGFDVIVCWGKGVFGLGGRLVYWWVLDG